MTWLLTLLILATIIFIILMNRKKMNLNKFEIGCMIVTISILICMTFFCIIYLRDFPKEEICDYDSCSQIAYTWDVNGSACFDKNNPECIDFLRLWDICQKHKNHVGVC